MKFDHLGIFVKNIKYGINQFKKIIPIKKINKLIIDKNLGVKIVFIYDNSNICYELVAPYGKKSPVHSVLKQRKNIINHIAYKTQNFEKKIKNFRSKGYIPLGPAKKAKAFNNSKVIFFLTSINVIVELIESK